VQQAVADGSAEGRNEGDMTKLTITEALAEVKTINSRIKKKRESIMRYFARDSKLKDPLEESGGSIAFVRQERQAIHDLEERIVTIRSAIQAKNLETNVQVGDKTRTVSAWLNWRREVAEPDDIQRSKEGSRAFLNQMVREITNVRQQLLAKGYKVVDQETKDGNQIVIAVNERELAADVETMETTLGDLDGKLSLINATTFIEI
jgi:hypothetical protein